MKLSRSGRVRETLPGTSSPPPQRTPATFLEHGAVYVLEPEQEEVYALDVYALVGAWYLVGEERSFLVDDEGTVSDLPQGADSVKPRTLWEFHPLGHRLMRCPDCDELNDWHHYDDCPGP